MQKLVLLARRPLKKARLIYIYMIYNTFVCSYTIKL